MYEHFADELKRALEQGRAQPYETSETADIEGWGFRRGDCHNNAANYVRLHADATVIQGWLLPYGNAWAKHSIVYAADHRFIDVTERDDYKPFPFVPHEAVAQFCDVPFDQMPNVVPHYSGRV